MKTERMNHKKERKEPETEEFNEEKGKPSTIPNGENTIMFKVRWILFCGKMFVCECMFV